jgi:hypothetical protein
VSRILLEKGKQKELIDNVHKKTGLDWASLADICKICERTLRDWRREKYTISFESLKSLCKISNFRVPANIEILPEYWSVKKAGKAGALRRNEIYGNPGTPAGRKKGGLIVQKNFSLNPGYAKKVGFIVRKKIAHPRKSTQLAEFIGIVLGDGSITKYQVTISMNSISDISYGTFVQKLILRLFKISPRVSIVKKNTLQVVVTSRNLVEFLFKCGLKQGDKVAQQIDIPKWIMGNRDFRINCLRGLFDTDGGIYFHTHVTKGIKYRHMGLCFTNKSIPLLNSVYTILLSLGIRAKTNNKSHVSIYDRKEIKKYMNIIGSHNEKHINRFNSYNTSKF